MVLQVPQRVTPECRVRSPERSQGWPPNKTKQSKAKHDTASLTMISNSPCSTELCSFLLEFCLGAHTRQHPRVTSGRTEGGSYGVSDESWTSQRRSPHLTLRAWLDPHSSLFHFQYHLPQGSAHF